MRRGATTVVTLNVRNQTSLAYDFRVTAGDVRPRTGDDRAIVPVEPGTQSRGAGEWLSATPKRWRLAAATERKVRVAIRVPRDALLGGAYGTLVLQYEPVGRASGNVPIVAEVPAFFLLTVAGEYRRRLDARLVPADRWRWRGGHTRWTLELRNRGDLHENVSGRVEVDGTFAGMPRIAVSPGVLLPGEVRRQVVELDLRDGPDLFSASARVNRDDAQAVTARAGRVIVLPWWLVALGGAVVLVAGWRRRRSRGRGRVPIGRL